MTLKQYLVDFAEPFKELHRLSKVSGVSMGTLRAVANGATISRAATAKAIVAATEGKVTAQELLDL